MLAGGCDGGVVVIGHGERPEHFYADNLICYIIVDVVSYVDDDDDDDVDVDVVSKKARSGRVLKRCAVQNSDAYLPSALRSAHDGSCLRNLTVNVSASFFFFFVIL